MATIEAGERNAYKAYRVYAVGVPEHVFTVTARSEAGALKKARSEVERFGWNFKIDRAVEIKEHGARECSCPHEGTCPHHKHPPEVPTIPVVCDAPPAASENPVEVPPPPGACLPFVYVAVDVENFEACMKNAERYGKLDNARLVYDFLSPWYHRRDQEIFLVVLFDVRHQLRGVNQVAIGQRSRVNTGLDDLRRVITLAGAERFVVAHNHPTGKASPSDDDKALTKVIKKEFKDSPNLVFEDHVIVGRGEFYSFHEKKMFTV